MNLHSEALEFEAIHRVVTQTDANKLMSDMTEQLGLTAPADGMQTFTVILNGERKAYSITKPTANLTVGSLQNFLDRWLADNAGKIDYIHGEDNVAALAKDGCVGLLFDGMAKSELFRAVELDGALPRKTFSMGHAEDKRYYIEARRIVK